MRVAFYAPMKSPDHPVPSGDRRVARLLMAALAAAGHEVVLASRFRSYEPAGDPARQARLAGLGHGLARRIVARRPRWDAWLTYHLYYKAPDHLGPAVARALAIPYIVAEASVAPKRAAGAWAAAHAAVLEALGVADAVLCPNPNDVACLRPAVRDPCRLVPFPPFLDARPFADARREPAAIARRFGLDPARCLLLTVAMMRHGDKLTSYRLLAEALRRLGRRDWQLLVAGAGPARAEVEAAFAGLPVAFAGEVAGEALPALYAGADLLVWPAWREAYGMALLEAAAAGLPVVAGRTDGVPAVVEDGVTGRLVALGDVDGLAAAIAALLDDPALRRGLGAAASERVAREHDLARAAARLDAVLRAPDGCPGARAA